MKTKEDFIKNYTFDPDGNMKEYVDCGRTPEGLREFAFRLGSNRQLGGGYAICVLLSAAKQIEELRSAYDHQLSENVVLTKEDKAVDVPIAGVLHFSDLIISTEKNLKERIVALLQASSKLHDACITSDFKYAEVGGEYEPPDGSLMDAVKVAVQDVRELVKEMPNKLEPRKHMSLAQLSEAHPNLSDYIAGLEQWIEELQHKNWILRHDQRFLRQALMFIDATATAEIGGITNDPDHLKNIEGCAANALARGIDLTEVQKEGFDS
jgi:hypothetical protein